MSDCAISPSYPTPFSTINSRLLVNAPNASRIQSSTTSTSLYSNTPSLFIKQCSLCTYSLYYELLDFFRSSSQGNHFEDAYKNRQDLYIHIYTQNTSFLVIEIYENFGESKSYSGYEITGIKNVGYTNLLVSEFRVLEAVTRNFGMENGRKGRL